MLDGLAAVNREVACGRDLIGQQAELNVDSSFEFTYFSSYLHGATWKNRASWWNLRPTEHKKLIFDWSNI